MDTLLIEALENTIVDKTHQYYTPKATNSLRNNGIPPQSDSSAIQELDPFFFEKWIPNDLFVSFKAHVLEILRIMPEDEKELFFEDSVQQFKNHTPKNRLEALYQLYWDRDPISHYTSDRTIDQESRLRFNPTLNAYNKHFSKFEELILKLYNDFKNGTLNTMEHIFGETDSGNDSIIPQNKIIQSVQTQQVTNHGNEIEGLFQDWIRGRTTLDQWLSPQGSKFLDIFTSMANNEEEAYNVMGHQVVLYNEFVSRMANNFIRTIESNSDKDQALIKAKRDLTLINDLIKGEITSVKAKNLKNSFSIIDWEKTCEQINTFIDNRSDPVSISDIHSDDCFYLAEAILNYREYLNSFIKSKPYNYSDEALDFSYQPPVITSPPITPLKQYSKEELEVLYCNWINGITTLEDWQSFPDSKVVDSFSSMANDEDEYHDVIGHQMKLYSVYVKRLSDQYISDFNSNTNQANKIDRAQRDLSLIKDLINGDINEVKADLLESNFNIEKPDNWETMHRLINYFIDYEADDPFDSRTDIHNSMCLAQVEAIFAYRDFLTDFLAKDPKPERRVSITKPKELPASYTYKKYNSNLTALTNTLNFLKKHKLLHENTDIVDFRKIFNNSAPSTPIIWTGNISALVFFIKLIHLRFKYINDLDKIIWKVTDNLFVDENNNPFGYKNYRGQKPPKITIALLEKAAELLK